MKVVEGRIQLDGLDGVGSGLIEVVVVELESHGMTSKVLAVLIETVLSVELSHGDVVESDVGVLSNTVLTGNVHGGDVGQEGTVLQLLHHAEKRSLESLIGGGGHLRRRKVGAGAYLGDVLLLAVVDEGTLDGGEFHVDSGLGLEEHLDELA